ncbi:hypothetical protein Q7P36_007167 [Cladosporium allicinum]
MGALDSKAPLLLQGPRHDSPDTNAPTPVSIVYPPCRIAAYASTDGVRAGFDDCRWPVGCFCAAQWCPSHPPPPSGRTLALLTTPFSAVKVLSHYRRAVDSQRRPWAAGAPEELTTYLRASPEPIQITAATLFLAPLAP